MPFAVRLTGANRDDSQEALALVDAIPPLHGEHGRPRQRPDCVLGDRGYDAAAIRRGLRARHIVPGVLIDIEWSPDGSSVYFDRLRDVPQGIYRVPVLGGEPRLVLERAATPVPLPDGTLLVTRIDNERRKQIVHFWPETGRLENTGAMVPAGLLSSSIRAFRDGREAVFYGKPVSAPDAPDDVCAIDLTSHAIRRLGHGQPFTIVDGQFPPALATTPDGKEVLAIVSAGDMNRVVALSRDAGSPPRAVLGLTGGGPYSLDDLRRG